MGDSLVFQIYPLILSVIYTVILILPVSPLYLVSLFIVGGGFMVYAFVTRVKEIPLSEAAAIAQSAQTAQLADTVINIATVKSFGLEKYEEELFQKRSKFHSLKQTAVMHRTVANQFGGNIFVGGMNVVALVVAVISVLYLKAPVGTLLLIVALTENLLGRIWTLQYTIKSINRVMGDSREMTEIMRETPEIQDIAKPQPVKMSQGAVRFHDVDFRYDGQTENLFTGFELSIASGERVGLVGPSGGGKTTITKLLLRFMDIQGGEITIDGQNVAEVRQSELRQNITYVPQEPMLFHRSLADNIRYGRTDASDAEIRRAAEQARADEFIDKLPLGFETLVGERGTKLSGGQRQRVAIARAMLKNSPVLLLDEATSALDSHSEKLIQEALHELMAGRTTIVIAHRLSTIAQLDRIIVIDEGKVIEEGTHSELLGAKGLYSTLWNHQSGGFLIENEAL